MPAKSNFSEEKMIVALATGSSVPKTAREAGVTERTIYRRLEDPAVRSKIAAIRDATVGSVVGTLVDINTKAAKVLKDLLDSEDEKIQLHAAAKVIELGMKIRDSNELAERVTDLERKNAEQQEKDRQSE